MTYQARDVPTFDPIGKETRMPTTFDMAIAFSSIADRLAERSFGHGHP